MRYKSLNYSVLVIFIVSIPFLFFSCIPQKKLRYLQQKQDFSVVDTSSLPTSMAQYKLKTGDKLYIEITSNATELLPSSFSSIENPALSNDLSAYIHSFSINDSGQVEIPLIGTFMLEGLTLAEADQMITSKVKQKYSFDAEVLIKYLSFKVSVLGEVNEPGIIQVYQSELNILEAMAYAGDLTPYGDRTNIMIVREDKNNKQVVNYIDISSAELLNKDYYYLQPGDIVYVQPLDAKTYGFGQVQWGVVISSISTLIAIIALFSK